MAIEHRDLTGSALHEPKGVESASAGLVYVSDGAGSGDWTDLLADVNNANLVPVTVYLPDVSAPSSVFVVPGIAGLITDIHVVLHGAITVADATITAKVNTVPVTGVSITVAYSGSAAGTVFSDTATALNSVGATDAIEIITDGASTTTAAATVTIMLDVS